ncbi:hypothetical protein KC959_00505 [Candidatus Saccharibacteria bacterium]|nr:hypothetical protein [Candidatus Saccharibacteria bacterium]
MKYSDVLFFIKYPYASGIIATVWIGSTFMLFKSNTLEPLPVIIVNLAVTWLISWLSYRSK